MVKPDCGMKVSCIDLSTGPRLAEDSELWRHYTSSYLPFSIPPELLSAERKHRISPPAQQEATN